MNLDVSFSVFHVVVDVIQFAVIGYLVWQARHNRARIDHLLVLMDAHFTTFNNLVRVLTLKDGLLNDAIRCNIKTLNELLEERDHKNVA